MRDAENKRRQPVSSKLYACKMGHDDMQCHHKVGSNNPSAPRGCIC